MQNHFFRTLFPASLNPNPRIFVYKHGHHTIDIIRSPWQHTDQLVTKETINAIATQTGGGRKCDIWTQTPSGVRVEEAADTWFWVRLGDMKNSNSSGKYIYSI